MRSTLALFALLLFPAAAVADAPWTPERAIPGAAGYAAPVVFTANGHGVVAATAPNGGSGDTLLTPVSSDGALGTTRKVKLSSFRLAAYASDHIALAGTRSSGVALATGTPSGGVGSPSTLSGTKGQQLYAIAGGKQGTVALVTGSSRERIVWVRSNGSTRRSLTIKVSNPRDAAVAVGSKGDVLVVWEDDHKVFARHRGTSGSWAPAHELGDGVQSQLQAVFDDSGRQEAAWMSQRVGEGDAATGATAYYTSAAKGHGWAKAVVVGRDELTGTGRYVAAPGIRLVPSGTDSGVLALTVYNGANFRVAVGDVAGGTLRPTVLVSPAGQDCVLADLSYARAGGTLVLWRSGTRGHDATGEQRVFASVRPAGLFDFVPVEAVSGHDVPERAFGAVDPKTGNAVAAWGYLQPSDVVVSSRPAR